MAIKSSNDLQINGLLSESSHYLIISKEPSSGMIKALHLESNDEVQLGISYILNHTDSADIFEKEIKVSKEDKKDGTPGIRTIWENINTQQAFTVCFKKQDTNKTKKAFLAEKEAQREQAIVLIEKAKQAKKSMAEAYKEALCFIQDNPISPIIEGESRILRGYKLQFSSRDGFYDCIDVDLEGPNRCRKVNIRSIEWLIYNGVKYVVE